MSIREALLCDSSKCNNPAKETCALCTLDRCAEHMGKRYLTITVVEGESGKSGFPHEFLGKLPAVAICDECHNGLYQRTVTNIETAANAMPLSDLVAPLRNKLIEAASALLAEEKLKKHRVTAG